MSDWKEKNKTWKTRLVDARFSKEEIAKWEHLVFKRRLTQDEATDIILKRREGGGVPDS
jgi:hypothetical protein